MSNSKIVSYREEILTILILIVTFLISGTVSDVMSNQSVAASKQCLIVARNTREAIRMKIKAVSD